MKKMVKRVFNDKSLINRIIILGVLCSFAMPLSAQVSSLRGDTEIDSISKKPVVHKQMVVAGGFERNFDKQPPLIPHNIEKYSISLRNNGCLSCHGQEAFEKEHSKKVGDSHFYDREGKKLKEISKRRYFCTQCHVPQVQTKPLVNNAYQPVK